MTDGPALGLILAGGLGRRMGGGDKTLHQVAGRPILGHIVERLRPQVVGLVLNANGNPDRFVDFGLLVLPDTVPDHPGPLAGIMAGLNHAVALGLDWVVSVPADAPFLPFDLVDRLHAARRHAAAPMAVAGSGGRTHPVAALWPTTMRDALSAALAAGQRKVGAVTASAAVATWADVPIDPFFNINTADDLAQAATLGDPTLRRPHPGPS